MKPIIRKDRLLRDFMESIGNRFGKLDFQFSVGDDFFLAMTALTILRISRK